MSLKFFHIFFISISVLLSFGFGAWLLLSTPGGSALAAALSILAGIGLIGYGVYFLRKTRRVGML